MKAQQVNILKIQRFCINDGPGIRTTLFFKGCPLRCQWCHNPESQSADADVLLNEQLCERCGLCARACPNKAHVITPEEHYIDHEKCVRCGVCVSQCVPGALSRFGEVMTVDEVMETVLRDKDYYDGSGGGVTLSGGEPLGQPEALRAIVSDCAQEGVSVYLDTCGYAERPLFQEIAPTAQGVLFDLKHLDGQRHRELVGVDNDAILDNFAFACSLDLDLHVRFVVVPGLTDDADNLAAMVSLFRRHGFAGALELLPYHRYGAAKYRHMGRSYGLTDAPTPTHERVDEVKEYFDDQGIATSVQ